jgi:hypothetical protein
MAASQGISTAMLLVDKARSGLKSVIAAKESSLTAVKAAQFGLSLGTAVATLAASVIGIGIIAGVLALAYGAVSKGKAAGHAEGGIVGKDGGEVAASDTVPAMLTPGELVLNAAQQRNVAGGMGGSTTDMKDTNQLLSDTKDQNDQVISELKLARINHTALMGTLKSAIDRIPMA